MNKLPHHSPKRLRQAGMTLIELMISITIGLFIIGAALMVFQNVTGIGRQISELTQLRQQGAHAFRAIGKQISEAGSVEPTYTAENNNFYFNPASTQPGAWDDNNSAIANWTPPEGTDFLGISQQVQTSADYKKLILNCVGAEVTSAAPSSNFYVRAVTGESYGDLMCDTGAAVDQPIVRNVNAFKVRYRVRPSVTNITTKQFVDTPTNWSLVDAVEVCLDLVGDRSTPTKTVDAGGDALDTNYTDCDGNPASRGNRLHVVQRNLFTVYSAQR